MSLKRPPSLKRPRLGPGVEPGHFLRFCHGADLVDPFPERGLEKGKGTAGCEGTPMTPRLDMGINLPRKGHVVNRESLWMARMFSQAYEFLFERVPEPEGPE